MRERESVCVCVCVCNCMSAVQWLLSTETRVRSRAGACAICGRQSGTGIVFTQSLQFSRHWHCTNAPHSLILPLLTLHKLST